VGYNASDTEAVSASLLDDLPVGERRHGFAGGRTSGVLFSLCFETLHRNPPGRVTNRQHRANKEKTPPRP
jgi:hypothetical protein